MNKQEIRPSRSTVPEGLRASVDELVADAKLEGGDTAQRAEMAQVAEALAPIPGHTDTKKAIQRAYRANAYIQHTPTMGRLVTITELNDPYLETLCLKGQRVSFVTRDPATGDVKVCKTMAANEAKARLARALSAAAGK